VLAIDRAELQRAAVSPIEHSESPKGSTVVLGDYGTMPSDSHQRAAEFHELAAHAHRTAAVHHGKEDHQTGQEQSRQALEHSKRAFEHSQEAHWKSINAAIGRPG
jgi:hypothetical protein